MRQPHYNHAWDSGFYTLATRCHTCTAVTLKYTEASSLTVLWHSLLKWLEKDFKAVKSNWYKMASNQHQIYVYVEANIVCLENFRFQRYCTFATVYSDDCCHYLVLCVILCELVLSHNNSYFYAEITSSFKKKTIVLGPIHQRQISWW